MDDADLVLDGNALGGVLGEVFIHDLTAARAACGGCGAVEHVGAEMAYTRGPGVVLRCRHCQAVLLVVSQRGEKGHVLGFENLHSLEIIEPEIR